MEPDGHIHDGPVIVDPARRRAIRWSMLAFVVGAVFALAANWYLQRTLILQDDEDRGVRYRQTFQGEDLDCSGAAEAIYDHEIGDPGYDGAPRSAYAFWAGCRGLPFDQIPFE